MSFRVLTKVAVFLSVLVASSSAVEASTPRGKHCIPQTPRQVSRPCAFFAHQHAMIPGVVYSNRGGGCVRTFNNGSRQIWRPATKRIEYRQSCAPDRFRTVTRYRTVFRCGQPVRRAYRERIRIPGRVSRVPHVVKVPGRWEFLKPSCGSLGISTFH